MLGLHLEPIGADQIGSEVNHSRFEHDVLGPQMQCAIRGSVFRLDVAELPMTVIALGGSENLPP